ncbi:ABC transporter ATP-binding protein [Alteromonas sp. ASW11-36]|uniref:ABC transporter ATP-binding protein n=1 Tax=Alteromonas arenosi TaxID=3055817 RepID=A0ABT7SU08_9ALTE|nr:ABC transporter ATP-binding protein [Alteromonas sp. ASW11-36]MDM7859666.1 ABC transporter ATP-binding protein [Alteromonas sp. ASW11-36]
MIEVRNLVKNIASSHRQNAQKNGIAIIDNLELLIEQGQSASVQGASGCGKTTLLHLLSGLDHPCAGTLIVAKHAIHNYDETRLDYFRRHTIGIVFQQFHLLESLNVEDNIAFTARLAGNLDPHHINNLMQQLGIADMRNQRVTKLSGGEQQRVAIARALAHKPRVVFADEPTGNLDEHTSSAVSELLFSTCRALNTTLLLVTHSNDVAALADDAYHMTSGQLTKITPSLQKS